MDAQQRHVVIDDVEILGPTRPRSPSCARAASTTAAIPSSRSSTMRVVGPFDAACRTRSPATRSRSSPGRPSWRGAFAEIGPVVVHTCDCGGPRTRACRLSSWRGPRSCAHTGGIAVRAYDDVVIVEPDGSLPARAFDVLARGSVDFVLVRNVKAGCYSFTARRPTTGPVGDLLGEQR